MPDEPRAVRLGGAAQRLRIGGPVVHHDRGHALHRGQGRVELGGAAEGRDHDGHVVRAGTRRRERQGQAVVEQPPREGAPDGGVVGRAARARLCQVVGEAGADLRQCGGRLPGRR
ncbi:hypothetical protein, partial [Actinomadura fibrosa]|uniref:hypothetical protein n=1 Tax=Actinomadura fibrosa TaxID=111802 RepID=UPI001A954FEA